MQTNSSEDQAARAAFSDMKQSGQKVSVLFGKTLPVVRTLTKFLTRKRQGKCPTLAHYDNTPSTNVRLGIG